MVSLVKTTYLRVASMAYVGMSKARLDDTRSDANPTPSTRRPLKLNTAKDESRLLPPLLR